MKRLNGLVFMIVWSLCTASGASLRAAEIPGVPVFGDDFNVSGLLIENWNVSKGVKCEDGRAIIPAGQDMTLRRIQDGDFAFTADLTVEKPDPTSNGHCGVIIDGIHFMIHFRGNAGTAYRVPGEERSRGNSVSSISGFEFGKPCRFEISRQALGQGFKYAYKVNGTVVDSFQVTMPATGKIAFYGYKMAIAVDNFQLYAIKKGDASNNLVVNSSFEYLQEGVPTYMRPGLGYKYLFDGRWEDFLKTCVIDTRERRSGRQSMRMTVGPDYPTANGIGTFNVNVAAKTPVTFSVWLKASADNFPVTLGLWELWHRNHTKGIRITRDWQRYAFTVPSPERAIVRASLSFTNSGTVWADDLQVELGTNVTPYRPSSLDKDKFAAVAEGEIPIEKDIALRRTAGAPVIDGQLEDVWFQDAARTDAFFTNGSDTPANKTEAYLACDGNALYLAVRAFVADPARVVGSPHPHDDLKTHGEDCIEIFLDTTGGRQNYYQFAVNAAGSKTDLGPGRILAWNGAWDAAARVNEKEKCIDYEVRLPLALFAGPELADKWCINIGRNDRERQKICSLTHVKEMSFHVPTLFPGLVLPEGVAAPYRVGFRSLRLLAGKAGDFAAAGTVANLTGQPLAAEIGIEDAATGAALGRQTMMLAPGNADVSVPVKVAAGAEALDAVARIGVAGVDRSAQAFRIALARPLEIYTRCNYYMNEPAAVLVGALTLPDSATLTGRVTVAGRTFGARVGPAFTVDVPLAGIANGEHPVTLEVLKGSETLASATTTLVKREFKTGATQIDRQRRCLVVDGKPYLAITPFFGVDRGIKPEKQDRVLKNMLRLHQEMGYRCFLAGAVDDQLVPAQTQAFFDMCAQSGVKIIYWPFQCWNRRDKVTPEQRLQSIKSDAIIAWMVVDEPELYAKSEEIRPYMEAYRKASPYVPVFMNNTLIGIPGRFAGLTTDILMLDDYLCNRENRKVAEMIKATDMMWEAGREDRTPVFYFLEGENLSNHYRECTYAEQVAETYGVIIAGARGVSYFCSMPLYPEDYRASVDVNRELLALEDVIFSLEETSGAKVSDPAVRFMTRKIGGKVYVIALNTSNDRPVKADITLPAEFRYARRAEVKFENRRVAVRNGAVSDRFKPLERHVYVADVADPSL